ncbi:MAG TPA: phosphate acyltransferase PlsX [Phycisphaerales bacterium]|nr:phosphate acyltransferase PlsX [Phycisphaerales bacterium]
MRIAIDAMGGDYAPSEIIAGALQGRDVLGQDDEIVLVGDESVIRDHLVALKTPTDTFRIFQAPDVIGMNESPIESLRRKPKSSIAVMAHAASHRQVDAVLSAGNTGACVAACQIRMRTLEGVSRPGIAVVLPTYGGPVTICDVGANIACKPIHLYQYAIMAGVYAREMFGIESPRIGIMNIGEEDAKGTDLIKKTRLLLKNDPNLNYIGYLEGRDLFEGKCDVVICEGFVGNVILKLSEGMANMVFKAIKAELMTRNKLLALWFKSVAKSIFKKYDYHEYGGALLLGVNGTAIICHGSSKARTIKNAISACKRFYDKKINTQIVSAISKTLVSNNGE